tara:strand:- start:180 stop:1103 length:924 start_codon:yes stop_codon:yes gene_type:complete
MKRHIPVLLDEVIKMLNIKPEGIYMDCTIGFGGHSELILNKLNSKGKLIGLDLDPYALEQSKKRLSQLNKNISLHNCCYSVFPQILEKLGINKIDGFLFDLGISSYQIDSTHRGFSYMRNATLDMRFNDNDDNIKSAKDLINTISEKELSDALKLYADIKEHVRIAKSIINYRQKKILSTTIDLKDAICNALPYENYKKLSQVFQVIRILVNNEIDNLKKALKSTVDYLAINGKIAIISFHSIEDRIIKHFFKNKVIYKNSTYDIEYSFNNIELKVLTKKPIIESNNNVKRNSRSRSAKLRVAERIA